MTFKYSNFRALKSVNPKFSGAPPPGPPAGALPCTPPGALRRAPGPHPKSARAYALAMCAPRTCLPKKIGPQQFKKIGSRFALAMCATRTCLPPHNQSLPPSCPPPHFLNPGAATMGYEIGLKCNLITLFIKVCSEICHIYAFYMTTKSMCIIFIYSKRPTQRNKHNGTCIHLHTPADTCELSIKYYYIRCNNLPQVL